MGMYTQVRGWLCIDSIGYSTLDLEIEQRIINVKKDFLKLELRQVQDSLVLHEGGNGSKYLFFGTELENYSYDCEEFLKILIKYFPNCEGRIDFQYEEDTDYESYESKVWKVSKGVITELFEKTHCYGYGLDFE